MFQQSPKYLLKLADHVGPLLDPPIQYEKLRLPDPVYVRLPKPMHTRDGDVHDKQQMSVCRLMELAASTNPCGASKDTKHLRCNQSGKGASRTLLIAYIPRCASAHDVEHVFQQFGTICRATIMREDNGQSKCFGFVRFEKHDVAKSALEACFKGHVVLVDEDFKAWHLKASWAKADQKRTGYRLAAVNGRSF
jgi:hypothetical protein